MSPQHWVSELLVYSVQIGLIIILALPLPAIVRLRHPALKLAYWRWLIVISLALPWLKYPFPAALALSSPLPEVHVDLLVSAGPASESGTWLWLLPLLVIAGGAALQLIRLAAGLRTAQDWRRRSHPVLLDPTLLSGLRARFRSRPAIRVSDRIVIPVSFGWRRPVLLVPSQFQTLPLEQQQAILCHEWLHIERRDWPFTVLEEIFRSLFWFHPLLLVLLDRIQLSREQAVDLEVVGITGRTRTYLETLRQAASTFRQASLASTVPFIRASHLRQRVVLLTQEVCMSKSRQWLLCACVVVFAGALSAAVLVAVPGAGIPQPEQVREPIAAMSPGSDAEIQEKEAKEKAGEIGISEDTNARTRLVKRVNPRYPAEAKQQGITGTVTCKVQVGKDGKPIKVTVSESPHELLSESAVEAIRQWEWAPVEKEGEPVEFIVTVDIHYELKD